MTIGSARRHGDRRHRCAALSRRCCDIGRPHRRGRPSARTWRRRRGREIERVGEDHRARFIDVHTHDDRALFASPEMAAKASQGVTTVITGNCGVSLAPLPSTGRPPPPLDLIGDARDYAYPRFADYWPRSTGRRRRSTPPVLVGHSRCASHDEANSTAGPRRRDRQHGRASAGGARCRRDRMSTGLYYAPAFHAPPAEIEALAARLRPAGALYTTHMRDEAEHVLDSLDESFQSGGRRGCRW